MVKVDLGETNSFCSSCRQTCEVCGETGGSNHHDDEDDDEQKKQADAVVEFRVYNYVRKCATCHEKQKPFDVEDFHQWTKEHPEPTGYQVTGEEKRKWDDLLETYIAGTDTDEHTARVEVFSYVTDTLARAYIKANPPPVMNEFTDLVEYQSGGVYLVNSDHPQAVAFRAWAAGVERLHLNYDESWDEDEIFELTEQVALETPNWFAEQAKATAKATKAKLNKARVKVTKLQADYAAQSAEANKLALVAGLPEPFKPFNDSPKRKAEASAEGDETVEEKKSRTETKKQQA